MTVTDPYTDSAIFLALSVPFYLLVGWTTYAIPYFFFWQRFDNVRPLAEKVKSSEPWFGCRRIEVGSGSMGSSFPTFYFQFNGQTVNVIQRDRLFPFVPRLLGMAIVSAADVRILSSRELMIFGETPNPIKAFLYDPLWEEVSKPVVNVYPDGTIVAG